MKVVVIHVGLNALVPVLVPAAAAAGAAALEVDSVPDLPTAEGGHF